MSVDVVGLKVAETVAEKVAFALADDRSRKIRVVKSLLTLDPR